MKWKGRAPANFLVLVLASGLSLASGGCDFFDNAGTVSGTVRYKGQTLSEGSVSFINDKGQTATGTIDQSGHYIVAHVPLGSAKIVVRIVSAEGPPPVSFAGVPKAARGKATGVKIPSRYGMAATSGLRHTVTKGKQSLDIDLKE